MMALASIEKPLLLGSREKIECQLKNFSSLTGYPVSDMKYIRKIGPRLHSTTVPPRGSELFVHRLPPDAPGDDIFWFFQKAGDIFQIRLMMRPSGLANRGYAFVTFANPEQAQYAIATLTKEHFRPKCKILIEKSMENNRLFLSGIPFSKNKSDIFEELSRIGMEGVVDIIIYKGYKKNQLNRGFVFIEFKSHGSAATAKREFATAMQLWNRPVILDWAEPLMEVDTAIMATVTRVFVRNLNIGMSKTTMIDILRDVLDYNTVEKVYKHADYCFVHFFTRKMAEEGLKKLQGYYCGTDVEVSWSKPPEMATKRFVPPRLKTKKNGPAKSLAIRNQMNVQPRNKQFLRTFKGEPMNFNRKEGQFLKDSWLKKNCNHNSQYDVNENNLRPWQLWSDANWFNNSLVNSYKSNEVHTPAYANMRKQYGSEESSGLQNHHREHELHHEVCRHSTATRKNYDGLIEDNGEHSIQDGHQTLNFRFQLDVSDNFWNLA